MALHCIMWIAFIGYYVPLPNVSTWLDTSLYGRRLIVPQHQNGHFWSLYSGTILFYIFYNIFVVISSLPRPVVGCRGWHTKESSRRRPG